MTGAQNWRNEVDATDYFGHRQKQLNLADRRPVIRRASDLVGPGIAQSAVRLIDFNDPLALFNGFFSAAAGAVNGPDGAQAHMGFISVDDEIGGVQMFFGMSDGLARRRIFSRSPADATSITWGNWTAV